MEKKHPKYLEDKDVTKDGIHIMMPFSVVTLQNFSLLLGISVSTIRK